MQPTNRYPASEEQLEKYFGKTRTRLRQLADKHTLTVQAWLASRSPHARCFKGVGCRASSTGLAVPLLNLALGWNYPPNIAPEEIDQEIIAVKKFFSERSTPWYWWIAQDPDQRQAIREQLAHHQIIIDRPELPAMIAPLHSTVLPPLDPTIRVWQASTVDDLKAASTIRRLAFRFPDGVALNYFEDMADDWLCGDPARLYLAGLPYEEPASMGALIMGEGLPGVYVMATLPNYGRHGLGKAILQRLMSEAANGGHTLLILTASRFGYPLYQQFGFQHIFDYDIYRYTLA
jgi:GNAT superfamily N-acetyltransferase